MKSRSFLASLAAVLGTVAIAFVAAWVVDTVLGPSAATASIVTALVVVALFATRPVDGLVAFAVATLLVATVEHWTHIDVRYLDEAAIPLLVATAALRHRSRISPPRPTWREGALAVLLVSGVVSSLMNGVPVAIWVPALGLLIKGFAFFYLVVSMRVDEAEVTRLSGVVFAVGMAIALIGLLQFLQPELARSLFPIPPFVQQRGTIDVVNSIFTHPALYGWLTVFLSLFLFARFTVLREWWALAIALPLGVLSLLSGRRTPLIGLAGGVVTAVMRQLIGGRSVLRALVPAVALVALIAVISAPLLGNFYRWTFVEYGEPPELVSEIFSETPNPAVLAPMAPRNALYLGSAAVARDHLPLGAGLGRFGSHMSREEYSPVYQAYGMDMIYGLQPQTPIAVTDTFWPMILGETGIIGLLAAVAFFGRLFLDLWRAAGTATSPAVRAFLLGGLLVFVETMVRSLTSPVFVAPPIAYFAFGAFGLSLALAERGRTSGVA